MDALVGAINNRLANKHVNHVISKILPFARLSRQHRSLLAASIALAYILLCRSLRYRRIKAQERRTGYLSHMSMQEMTNVEAQAIVRNMAEFEFPTIFRASLNFALFKTYGVPTISSLLVATRMFSTPENASRRYEDTTVLIGEFLAHDPQEQRTVEAIARMNYLHSPYIKAGKISNNDLLYTLSVFITEPISWINRFEWRETTDLEVCALGTFWKSVGDAMGIDYSDLRPSSWATGIDFYHSVKEWAEKYEAKVMMPCQTNKTTADELVPLLLFYVPRPFMSFARQSVGVLMGERLRWAMSYPDPSLSGLSMTYSTIAIRRLVLRYLMLPRMYPAKEFTPQDPNTGRYYHRNYLVHPYYVKPTFLSRWGPTALMTRALGGIVPGGKDGGKYYPEGYTFTEVGPDRKRNEGKNELNALSQAVRETRPSGCPFMTS